MAEAQAEFSKWQNELTPNIVDRLASVTPDAPYALYPNSPITYDEGYRTVTYKEFANAINGVAWWLKETLGPSDTSEILVYIGPNDIRYTAVLLGAVKAGYVAFFTSPRNSIPAHGALFKQLSCRIMVTPDPTPPGIETILNAFPMKHLHVPSIADLLGKIHPHYPFNKTFEASRSEPWCIFHTSGSTGIPKPLIWTHETSQRSTNFTALDPPPGFRSLGKISQGKRILNIFPPFHGACIAVHLIMGVPLGAVSVATLSGAIPTGEGVVQALKTVPADVAFLPPSIIAELSQNAELLEFCSQHLELILYAGGDLPQATGDKIAAKIPIRCQYGSSEFGMTNQILHPEITTADWRWVEFHPDLGLEFEELTPGIFEMVLKKDSKYEQNQMPFSIGPFMKDLEVYRTRDLFAKHPTIPNCWGWRARADDVIVFLNGEKTNPISMEQHILASNSDVSGVLVIGAQRFQAALLVEPAPRAQVDAAALIEKIWPSIDEANKLAPAHARVEKSMISLTSRDKPMLRSGKGTIQRQGTVDQYTAEMDELYLNAEVAFSEVEQASVDTKDAAQVSRFIQEAISRISPDLLQEGIGNFFALGMDSLMAMRLIRALRHGLGQPDLHVSVIHNNPSVEQLVQHIVGANAVDDSHSITHRHSEIEALLNEYEQAIDRSAGEVAVLTGSTGSLGTHLLEALLANPTISHIYCLNRRKDAQAIHEAKAKATGFSLKQYLHRVTFLYAALDQSNLGIPADSYETLRSKTTLIIHNAWPVNFIMPLETFRPHFDGLTNLLRLASSRPTPAKVFFVSSISSTAQFSRASNPHIIPEEVVRDFDAPYQIGYGKSKLVSELLCDKAARRLGIPVSFARVGQVAGPVNGESAGLWNTAEWLPSLILTSISLGALPDDLGADLNQVNWMPVDLLAKVIVELGIDQEDANGGSSGAQVFNLLNPRVTSWKDVLPGLVSSIAKHSNKHIDTIPLTSWLAQVKDIAESPSADTEELARTHPAIKLHDFYAERMLNSKETLNWEMGRSTSKSETLRTMPSVGGEWIERWVEAWVAELSRARSG